MENSLASACCVRSCFNCSNYNILWLACAMLLLINENYFQSNFWCEWCSLSWSKLFKIVFFTALLKYSPVLTTYFKTSIKNIKTKSPPTLSLGTFHVISVTKMYCVKTAHAGNVCRRPAKTSLVRWSTILLLPFQL